MMTLWCIFGSPLMLGAEMTSLDPWTLSLLQNEALLRLENGQFISRQVLRDGQKCVWCAVDPKTGEYYVALFNLKDEPQEISVTPEECASMFPEEFPMREAPMEEIWSGAGYTSLSGTVAPHGTLLFHTNMKEDHP